MNLTREEQQTIAEALIKLVESEVDAANESLRYAKGSHAEGDRFMARYHLMKAERAFKPLYRFTESVAQSQAVEAQIIALEERLNEKTATDKVTA